MEYINQQRKIINENIQKYLNEYTEAKFFDAAKYITGPEGNRYRSLIALEVYEILGGKQDDFLKSVVGIECLHHASLIFDDLPCMDDSPLRKGKKTTHLEFGEDIAVLAGIFLLEKGRQLIYENAREHTNNFKLVDKIMALVHKDTVSLLVGQEIDLKFSKTDEELFDSICKKNFMFHLASVLPVHMASTKKDSQLSKLKIFNEIGVDLSIAYQLFDDLRDIEGDTKITGKPVGVDKEKNTSVYRYDAQEVKKRLKDKENNIIQSIRKIKLNSKFEEIVKYMLNIPS